MARDRRLPGSAASYPDDRDLLVVVLAEPPDVVVWPSTGLAEAGYTAGQQAVLATWRLDVEVRNAGFGRYFAGLDAEAAAAADAALAGLRRLGAEEHRTLLVEALALLAAGVPHDPEARFRRAARAAAPLTEEQYEREVRHAVIGQAGPSLEAVRERVGERRRWEAELRRIFGSLDDRYRALARHRPLERVWVAYVRGHPGEFFAA